jgi:hypothetical protein
MTLMTLMTLMTRIVADECKNKSAIIRGISVIRVQKC